MKEMKNIIKSIINIFYKVKNHLIFGLIVILWFFCPNLYKYFYCATLGDAYQGVSALFSGLALAYLIFTFEAQKDELELTRKELFESKNILNDQVKISSLSARLEAITKSIKIKCNSVDRYLAVEIGASEIEYVDFGKLIPYIEFLIMKTENDIKKISNGVPTETKDYTEADLPDLISKKAQLLWNLGIARKIEMLYREQDEILNKLRGFDS